MAIVSPICNVRGKSFRLWSQRRESRDLLLDVPNYDFNWQHAYELATPLALDQVDRLDFEITFDNSSGNPVNPDPSQFVTWGDQTWEEMAVAFFEVAEPRFETLKTQSAAGDVMVQNDEARRKLKAAEESAEAFVEDFFARFDKNQDGVVQSHETPTGFRRFGFRRFDDNNDRILSREELRRYARTRFKD